MISVSMRKGDNDDDDEVGQQRQAGDIQKGQKMYGVRGGKSLAVASGGMQFPGRAGARGANALSGAIWFP